MIIYDINIFFKFSKEKFCTPPPPTPMVKQKTDARGRSPADLGWWKHVDDLNFPVWIKLPLPRF